MREFELKIDEAIVQGLTPLRQTPFNAQLLLECLGFRLGPGALEPYRSLTNPFPGAIDLHYLWPFPQFITGELYNFLIVRDEAGGADLVYIISDDHATVTLIATLPYLTYGIGTLMEVADFGLYAFLTNGVAMVYYNTVTDAWDTTDTIANIPRLRTICNFKGQAVGGNVTSVWKDCDETYYVWSKIGEMDFIPDRRNTSGYRRCPFGGEVFHTRRLGDNVIGYSSKGITLMNPVVEPAPSFGFVELDDVGLANQGAMNGNLRRQVYVGEDRVVREVTKEGVKELGYYDYMSRLGDTIIVSYDPGDKDFYIGDEEKTYLLSPNGLTEIPQHPSAVWRRGGVTYCVPDSVDPYKALITTNVFDMGYRGQKTVFSIESDLLSVERAEAAADYAKDLTSHGTTVFKPLNKQGIASLVVTGNAFKFHLRFDPVYTDIMISYIKVRYKMTDLRGIRGIYAPSPRGQMNYAN